MLDAGQKYQATAARFVCLVLAINPKTPRVISRAGTGDDITGEDQSITAFILVARQRSAFNSGVYTRPCFFEASDITIGVTLSPALMLHLLVAVCHG